MVALLRPTCRVLELVPRWHYLVPAHVSGPVSLTRLWLSEAEPDSLLCYQLLVQCLPQGRLSAHISVSGRREREVATKEVTNSAPLKRRERPLCVQASVRGNATQRAILTDGSLTEPFLV